MIDLNIKKRNGQFQINTTFAFRQAGVTAIIGESGAGKTSIINMVAGLMRPDDGHIIINGRTLFDSETGCNISPEKRHIGYIFQDGRLFPHLSVRHNLFYGMNLIPGHDRFITVDQVVDLLGIGHLLKRMPSNLSGGEKQRVAIGRALLTSPQFLLMDEPLASLDEARKSDVLPFIGKLTSEFKIPILYVSHSLNEVLNLADTVVILKAGSVIAYGDADEVLSRPDMQQFLGTSNYGAVIPTVVKGQSHNLTTLHFHGGELHVPSLNLEKGAKVVVLIKARNVAISLDRPLNTSFQNILPARIDAIIERDEMMVDIRLDIGCMIIARITCAARESLGLKPGQQVFALIKGVAVSTGNLSIEDE
ncbi:MAG: molybdenum ABC transporter ATP-binding protein [Deltaproteobacteria bacterium]|nr:molybdenum ABC transporter ATP-binding protein [Deltaproteobacteria bacterium]